jgi:hypothetical protein
MFVGDMASILYRHLRFVLLHAIQLMQERRLIKATLRTVPAVFSIVKWKLNIVLESRSEDGDSQIQMTDRDSDDPKRPVQLRVSAMQI